MTSNLIIKRLFDIFFSLTGIVLLFPLFMAVSIFIKLDSPGAVFFRQERIGKNFRPFIIYKFRTMAGVAAREGPLITVRGDDRVTRAGRFLRKTKIDELPQLINILKGDMSFVGPRPEVRKYVDLFREDYEALLIMRPGITDPASIRFSDEESVLSAAADWENAYVGTILPAKIKLARGYVNNHNILMDLRLIIRTLMNI